jgi:cytoskeletal protein CcmA (bactofilin family)
MKALIKVSGNGLLWFLWTVWLMTLFCYVFEWRREAVIAAALLSLTFVLYSFFYKKGFYMFRKKPQQTTELVENKSVVDEKSTSPTTENVQTTQGSRRCTVVASNTVFSGNTEIEGDIQVYGKMLGQINLKDGILYIMRGGFIDGEFTAPSIIINGRVEGTCISENIEIHEHGEMEGISRSGSLSIRPGGSFIGQSERLAVVKKEPEAERVVKIKKNQSQKPAEAAAGVSLAMNE